MLEGLEIQEANLSKSVDSVRIDSEYFRKEFIDLELYFIKNTYSYVYELANISDGDHAKFPENQKQEVRYLQAKDIKNSFVEDNAPVFVSQDYFLKNKRSHILGENILLSIMGNVGDIAVTPPDFEPCMANRAVAILRNIKNINIYFLFTFLKSYIAKQQIAQQKTGGIQERLNLELLSKIKVPLLSDPFQENIGRLVKASYNLREEYKRFYFDAEQILFKIFSFSDLNLRKNTNIKSLKESFSSTGRLDAEYYQPKYENYRHIVTHYENGFTFIRNEFEHIIYTSSKKETGYYYIEIGDINVSDGSCQANYIETDSLPANAKTVVKEGDVLISNVRPNRGAVSIINTDYKNLIVSGAFTVLRTKQNSQYSNELLKVLFRLPMYRDWLLQFNVGTQYPVIKDEDILNLPIPIFSDDIQNEVTVKIRQSEQLKKQSEQLLEVAKAAVEIAIEQNEEAAIEYINSHSQLMSENGNLH